MVKEYISSQDGVSREDMKKLAEAGDWKAALIIGLTNKLRFVLDWDECELAIRPPFMKSRPFSHRKAIKYYNMAAEENSVEVAASLGRVLGNRYTGRYETGNERYSHEEFRQVQEFSDASLLHVFPRSSQHTHISRGIISQEKN